MKNITKEKAWARKGTIRGAGIGALAGCHVALTQLARTNPVMMSPTLAGGIFWGVVGGIGVGYLAGKGFGIFADKYGDSIKNSLATKKEEIKHYLLDPEPPHSKPKL